MASPIVACNISFDDDIFALTLQLEEVEAQLERQTGKWREDSPPDFALAFVDFESEMKKAIQLVEGLAACSQHCPSCRPRCRSASTSKH